MRLLLDTHALLWWLAGDSSLSHPAQEAIGAAETAYVSAASAWEISTKFRIGKLPGVAAIAGRLPEVIEEQGFVPLAVTLRHGAEAGHLSGPHKDPFDRMLIAQARLEDLTLVSREALFDSYGVQRLW